MFANKRTGIKNKQLQEQVVDLEVDLEEKSSKLDMETKIL
jgi:hypothetical protein